MKGKGKGAERGKGKEANKMEEENVKAEGPDAKTKMSPLPNADPAYAAPPTYERMLKTLAENEARLKEGTLKPKGKSDTQLGTASRIGSTAPTLGQASSIHQTPHVKPNQVSNTAARANTDAPTRIVYDAKGDVDTGADEDGAGDNLFDGFDYLKRDLVRLLGILCYEDRAVQDRIRNCDGIVVVMNLCVIDDRNPCACYLCAVFHSQGWACEITDTVWARFERACVVYTQEHFA